MAPLTEAETAPVTATLVRFTSLPSAAASTPLDDWFVVAVAREVPQGQIVQAFLHGQELALWRTAKGAIQAWENRCPHRGTRLTMGRIVDDQLTCAYHGWRFAARGQCTYIPAHPTLAPPKTVCVKTYQAIEQCGMVWVSLAQPSAAMPPAVLADDAHRLVFCRSFVTYRDAEHVLTELLGDAGFGYQALAPHVLIGPSEVSVVPVLFVQPMAQGRSILYLWARGNRDGGGLLEEKRRVCAAVKHQRRRLEACA